MTGGLRLEYATTTYSVVLTELTLFWDTAIMRALKELTFSLIHMLKIYVFVYLQLAVLRIKGAPRQCLQDLYSL